MEWIEGNRSRLCKLPQDKIYSMIGLTSDTFRKRIGIDYEQSVELLYKNVVKWVIEDSQSLDILCHLQHSLWNWHLPFWMPDWRLPQRAAIYADSAHALGSQLDLVTETHLEFQLLPGMKDGTRFDLQHRLRIKPTSISRWRIQRHTVEDLFIRISARWRLDDVPRSEFLLAVLIKMILFKRYLLDCRHQLRSGI
jgi:hypothetical protein